MSHRLSNEAYEELKAYLKKKEYLKELIAKPSITNTEQVELDTALKNIDGLLAVNIFTPVQKREALNIFANAEFKLRQIQLDNKSAENKADNNEHKADKSKQFREYEVKIINRSETESTEPENALKFYFKNIGQTIGEQIILIVVVLVCKYVTSNFVHEPELLGIMHVIDLLISIVVMLMMGLILFTLAIDLAYICGDDNLRKMLRESRAQQRGLVSDQALMAVEQSKGYKKLEDRNNGSNNTDNIQ